MSQIKPRFSKLKRREYIKQQITQKTQGQIAIDCGVARETISRDIREMRESGEWFEWIEIELLRLHVDGDVEDDLKYREMAKLYAKNLIDKHQIDGSGEVRHVLEIWRPGSDDDEEVEN